MARADLKRRKGCGARAQPVNGEGNVDHPRRHRDIGGCRAPALRWLLTALVIAVAGPMLTACGTPILDSPSQMILPYPPNCEELLGAGYCGRSDVAKEYIGYDPSTGTVFKVCTATENVALLTGGKRNCGLSVKSPIQPETHPKYFAWLATQGIMVPGVPDQVLTNTPVMTPPPPDG